MTTVSMREAKKHLPRLLDAVAHGEVVIITKAGTPVAKLTRVDLPTPRRQLGFLTGQAATPGDVDNMAAEEVATMFGTVPRPRWDS